MILTQLKQSVRIILKNKLFAFVNIAGLSLSICLVILIGVYLQREKSVDSFHANSNRIYRVLHSNECLFSPPFGQYIVDNIEGVEGYCRTFIIEATLKLDNNLVKSDACFFVDSTFFQMFEFKLIEGDPDKALVGKNNVILSRRFAERIFGSKNAIGETIRYNNRLNFTVSGIAEDFSNNTHFKPVDVIFPFHAMDDIWGTEAYLQQYDWRYFIPGLYVLASKNVDLEKKGDELFNKVKSWYWLFQNDRNNEITFQPISEAYLNAASYGYPMGAREGNKKLLKLLLAIVIGISIIALINYINLNIINSISRFKEISIRKVTGANSVNIMFQLFLETFIVGVIAIGSAFVLVKTALPTFNELAGYQLTFSEIYNPFLLLKIAYIVLPLLFLAGILPAFIFSRNAPLFITNKTVKKLKISFVQKSMVVFQYTILIVLFISMFIIVKQTSFMKNYNIGINKNEVVYIPMNSDFKLTKEAFKSEVQKIMGVKEVSYCSGFPGVGIMPLLIEKNEKAHNLDWLLVDEAYFKLLEIPVRSSFLNDQYGCYLSKSAIKKLEIENLEESFEINMFGKKTDFKIIDVLGDVNYHSLYTKAKPTIYTKLRPENWVDYTLIRLSTNDITGTISELKQLFTSFSSNFPFELAFLNDTINKVYEQESRTSKIVSWFSLFAILIASMGIFSLAVYSSQQRTKEIGVRVVNGAKISEIIKMLNIDFLKWVVLAFFIAIPIAFLIMKKWIQSFAYQTEFSWWLFVLAGFVTLFIALVSVSWQTFKAAAKNPVEALRYE